MRARDGVDVRVAGAFGAKSLHFAPLCSIFARFAMFVRFCALGVAAGRSRVCGVLGVAISSAKP